jgi:uncharacterized SAM-binding protein YcdF (DUF218 family)
MLGKGRAVARLSIFGAALSVRVQSNKVAAAMYFYLSKTLGDLAVPSNLIALLIIGGALLWRSRFARLGRRVTIVGIVLFLIAGLTPLGTALLLPLENRFPRWDETRGPPIGIIVLGGVVNTQISLLRNDISLDSAAGRLIAAVELQRRYPGLRVLFSGGNSNLVFKGRSESDFAARFLENMGVPGGSIAVDNAARNTMENAVNAKKLADPKPGDRWLLVTSALHMPRAMGLFRTAGFPVEAYPVDYKTGGWRDVVAVPSLSLLGGFFRLDPAVHEWEGLFVDWIARRTPVLFPGPGDAPPAG